MQHEFGDAIGFAQAHEIPWPRDPHAEVLFVGCRAAGPVPQPERQDVG